MAQAAELPAEVLHVKIAAGSSQEVSVYHRDLHAAFLSLNLYFMLNLPSIATEQTGRQMIVDLHIHTNRSSYCSGLSPDELIHTAMSLGLDGVGVTEHSTHRGAQIAYDMAHEHAPGGLPGVEVYTPEGDMLVYGISSPVEADMDFEKLHAAVRSEGGVIIAAHPTRGFWGHHRKYRGTTADEILERLDGVETHNAGCKRELNDIAAAKAVRLGLVSVGGSDAHINYAVGKCLTVFERDFETEEELIGEIRAGRCRGAYLEEVLGDLQAEELK